MSLVLILTICLQVENKLMIIFIILKKQNVVLAEIPSHKDIEKQVILAGNKDIPELIETVIKSLKK